MKRMVTACIIALLVFGSAVFLLPRSFDSLIDAQLCGLCVMRVPLDLTQSGDDTFYEQTPETTQKVLQLLRGYRYSRLWLDKAQPYSQGALLFLLFQEEDKSDTFQLIFDGALLFCRSGKDERYYRVLGGSALFDALNGLVEVGA